MQPLDPTPDPFDFAWLKRYPSCAATLRWMGAQLEGREHAPTKDQWEELIDALPERSAAVSCDYSHLQARGLVEPTDKGNPNREWCYWPLSAAGAAALSELGGPQPSEPALQQALALGRDQENARVEMERQQSLTGRPLHVEHLLGCLPRVDFLDSDTLTASMREQGLDTDRYEVERAVYLLRREAEGFLEYADEHSGGPCRIGKAGYAAQDELRARQQAIVDRVESARIVEQSSEGVDLDVVRAQAAAAGSSPAGMMLGDD